MERLHVKSLFQFCSLGRLSHDVGWKYQDVVATLEAKRKVKSEGFHKKQTAIEKIKDQVKKDPNANANEFVPDGLGKIKWPNGDRYDGEFISGKLQG